MNKTELIKKIARETGVTQKVTTQVIDATFEAIGDSLVAGEKVSILNFGTFSVKPTAARTCRNPKTGETLDVPASKKVSFGVSSVLKNAVKGE